MNDNQKKPIVSIGVYVNNSGPAVKTSILSILKQKPNYCVEYIIVDNSDDKETQEYVNKFIISNDTFHYYYDNSLKTNNDLKIKLLELMKGEFCCLLSGRDFWVPKEKLTNQIEILKNHSEIIATTGINKIVDINGKNCTLDSNLDYNNQYKTNNFEYTKSDFEKGLLPSPESALLFRNVKWTSKEINFIKSHDTDVYKYLILKLTTKGPIHVSQECLAATRTFSSKPSPTKELTKIIGDDENLKSFSSFYLHEYIDLKEHQETTVKLLIGPLLKEYRNDQTIINAIKSHNDRPLVSIGMTTYNQEEFIAKAIESVLCQKVNFDYELVIAEDCSTDNTRNIVKKYAEMYPDKIKLILQEHNVGGKEQSRQLRKICRGVYRTHLEGDDYWLTNTRLQEQVDYLETHPDYIAVTGKVTCVNENGSPCKFPYGELTSIYCFSPEYTIKDFEKWLLPSHTGALLYRNIFYEMNDEELEKYESYEIPGDRKTALILVTHGRIHCLQKEITVRRITLNRTNNFTSVSRRIKPYAKVYEWMTDLEKMSLAVSNTKIDLNKPQFEQLNYALNNFFRTPSYQGLIQIRKIIMQAKGRRSKYIKRTLGKIADETRNVYKNEGLYATILLPLKLIVIMVQTASTKESKHDINILTSNSTKK